jgi:hypothetical protein
MIAPEMGSQIGGWQSSVFRISLHVYLIVAASLGRRQMAQCIKFRNKEIGNLDRTLQRFSKGVDKKASQQNTAQ